MLTVDNQRGPCEENARDFVRMGFKFIASKQTIKDQPWVREVGWPSGLGTDCASIFRVGSSQRGKSRIIMGAIRTSVRVLLSNMSRLSQPQSRLRGMSPMDHAA